MAEQGVCWPGAVTEAAFASRTVCFHKGVGSAGTFSALCSLWKCTLDTFSGKSSLRLVHVFRFGVGEVLAGQGRWQPWQVWNWPDRPPWRPVPGRGRRLSLARWERRGRGGLQGESCWGLTPLPCPEPTDLPFLLRSEGFTAGRLLRDGRGHVATWPESQCLTESAALACGSDSVVVLLRVNLGDHLGPGN